MADNAAVRRYGQALEWFSSHVHAVRADQWDAPTPCTDWAVRDLVNHLITEQLWVPRLVTERATVAQVGDAYDGNQLGDDPAARWDAVSAAALAAFRTPGALRGGVHLSYGDSHVLAYCGQLTTDAAVHGWDLARAIGTDAAMPPDLATASLREIQPYAGDLHSSGLFGAPVEPPEDADDLTRLLCLLGRRP